MQKEPARAHFYLSGRVQGVGMRFYIHALATRYSLSGFVRNLSDGRVESVLEGPRASIEKLIQELNQGEYSTYVRQSECDWEKPTGEFGGFEIR